MTGRINMLRATALLIFGPRSFQRLAKLHREQLIARPSPVQGDQDEDQTTAVRKGLAKGLGLLAVFIALGWATAQLLDSRFGPPEQWQNQTILYSGVALLLWSAIGRAGHSIKTMGAETLPELVDE